MRRNLIRVTFESNNEDHYLAVRITRSLETVLTNLTEGILPKSFDETAYGMLVADGMGGMAAGEVASSVALLKLLELVVQTPDWIMKMNQPRERRHCHATNDPSLSPNRR